MPASIRGTVSHLLEGDCCLAVVFLGKLFQMAVVWQRQIPEGCLSIWVKWIWVLLLPGGQMSTLHKTLKLHSWTFLYSIVISTLSGFRGFILQDTQRKVAVSFELYPSASLCGLLHFIFLGKKKMKKKMSVYIVAGIFSRSVNTSYTFQWERVGCVKGMSTYREPLSWNNWRC